MHKFCVFSGFLGSGKTTAMMAVTKYYSSVYGYGRAAMISNDLGHGVSLADHRFAQLSGCTASEMTETCICYQNENLAERLDSYYNEGFELVISDIPGFGVGAPEHVYHGLNEKYPGKYALSPFTVLVEPDTVSLLQSGGECDLAYILNTQLAEADLIVLSKCDTISDARREEHLRWLGARCPQAECVAVSARTLFGIDTLAAALRNRTASMRLPDIGYGGKDFMRAMDRISELYLQYHAAVCCDSFDGTAYLAEIAGRVKEKLSGSEYDIPHLKLLAWESEGDYGKVDLLGSGRPVILTRSFLRPCAAIAVIINGSAVCPAGIFAELVEDAVISASEKYRLECVLFKKECF